MCDIYVDNQEDVPSKSPSHQGRHIQLSWFFDSDHADDNKTQQTRIILF